MPPFLLIEGLEQKGLETKPLVSRSLLVPFISSPHTLYTPQFFTLPNRQSQILPREEVTKATA